MEKTVEWLEASEDHSFYLIGDSDRRNFYPAIIGLAKDNSHVAYSRERLEQCYMETEGWTWEETAEWIDFNVERALPYYGEGAPVILNNNFVSSRNKKYIPLKIKLDI